MKLPIEIVKYNLSRVTRLRWCQNIDGRDIPCEGVAPPAMESAIVELINMAEQQQKEIARLRKQISGLCDRVAAQSELLTKKAEVKEEKPQPAKKGK